MDTRSYAQGRSTSKLTKGRASTKTGTTIRFWPDAEIFTEDDRVQAVESSPSVSASWRS